MQSLRDLRKDIENAAIALAKMEKGTEEYEAAAADLAKKQDVLNEAVGNAKSANVAAEGSYNALTKQLAEARREWKALGDVTEEDRKRREQLGAEMNRLNNQLKMLDSSVGVYNRNVGNYGNQLGQAFTNAGHVIGGPFAQAVNTGNQALKLMATNPIGAMLTLLVPLIMKVANGMKSSEDAANAAGLAFSGFKAVGDVLTRVMQGLGRVIGTVGDKLWQWANRLGLVTEAMQERREIAAAEQDIIKEERRQITENARLAMEASDLRAQANDKLRYSNAERVAFLEQAVAKERAIADNELRLAKMRLETAQRTAALTANSREVNDELARAEAELYNVQRDYNQRTRRLQSELNAARKGEAADAAKAVTETEEEAFAKRLDALDAFNAKWEEKERERHEKEVKAAKEAFDKLRIQIPAELQPLIDAQNEAYGQDVFNKRKAEEAKQRLELATYNVAKNSLSAMADLLESGNEQNEKAVNTAKGLRAATATMDALSAANAAYASLASIPIVGPALGAAAAAAALVAGYANVREILNTSTRTASVPTAATAVQSSAVQAPAVVREVAAQRTVTSASQEETLNRIGDMRVYVVESDIEAVGKRVAVAESEAAFR